MKTRERLQKIKETKSRDERLRLAMDVLGATMDMEILENAKIIEELVHQKSMLEQHYHRNVSISEREMLNLPKAEQERNLKEAQSTLSNALQLEHDIIRQKKCSKDMMQELQIGNSGFFRDLADAIEKRKGHKPQPDKIRAAIIEFCNPPDALFSVRDILAHLRSKEIHLTEDSPRTIRRICRELGYKTSRTPGRPKKSGHESV